MLGKILETLVSHQGELTEDTTLDEFGRTFGKEFGIKFGIKFGENEKKLLLLLNSNPRLTAAQLSTELGISARAVEKQIRKLRELGILERSGSLKNGLWVIKK